MTTRSHQSHKHLRPPKLQSPTFMVLALVILSLFQSQAWSETHQPISTQEAASQLKQLKKKIALAQKSLSKARKNYSRQEKKLAKINNQLSSTTKKSIALKKSVDQVKETLEQLTKQTNEQKEIIENHYEWLKVDLVNSYQTGNTSHIKLLLNQKDPAAATRLLEYSEYIDAARNNKIQQLETHKQRLMALTEQSHLENERLQEKIQALQQQAKKYNALKQKQNKVLTGIKKQVKSRQARVKQFQQDRTHLDTLMQELISLESVSSTLEQSPFKALKGKLPIPAEGKINGSTQKKNAQGVKRKGLWIDTQKDQTIHAVHHGQVIFSEWLRGYGQLIIIDHGNQFYTLYGHNKSMLKKPGDWVLSGDPIAIAGETTPISSPNGGIIGQSRLYFEIRHKGRAINPSGWLATGRSSTR